MILKKYICTLFVLSILCLSCKSDYEKEVEKSKKLTTFLRTEKLPSYDSMYNRIIGERTNPSSQDLLIDSLYQTTKKVTGLIDSLTMEVERIDSTGENRNIGKSLLVNSPAGLKLTKGAKAIQQYCLELIKDDKKKIILNQQFLKYKGYLGSTEFNDIYFVSLVGVLTDHIPESPPPACASSFSPGFFSVCKCSVGTPTTV